MVSYDPWPAEAVWRNICVPANVWEETVGTLATTQVVPTTTPMAQVVPTRVGWHQNRSFFEGVLYGRCPNFKNISYLWPPPPFPQLTKSICKHVGPFSPWNVILWYSRRIEVYCDVAEKKKFKKTFDMGRLPLPASTLLCYISLLSGLWNLAHGGNPL